MSSGINRQSPQNVIYNLISSLNQGTIGAASAGGTVIYDPFIINNQYAIALINTTFTVPDSTVNNNSRLVFISDIGIDITVNIVEPLSTIQSTYTIKPYGSLTIYKISSLNYLSYVGCGHPFR